MESSHLTLLTRSAMLFSFLGYGSGLVLGHYFSFPFVLVGWLFLSLGLLYFLNSNKAVLFLSLICLGVFQLNFSKENKPKVSLPEKSWLIQKLQPTQFGTKVWIENNHAKFLAFADSSLSRHKVGDTLFLAQLPQPKPISISTVPLTFDYSTYLAQQNIHAKVYLRQKHILRIGTSTPTLRDKLSRFLDKLPHTSITTKQLAGALILGNKKWLREEKEMPQLFRNTGLIHILAISGMHIGILYWLFSKVLSMLTKRQRFRLWTGVFSCIPIWGFLYFLDFPSAALRATIMCSLYAIYRVQHRRPNSLQVLITTAFLILLFQPLQLFQLGFQLSFSAVLSIILFFRPIRNWMQTSVHWLDKPLDLIALSLSAQIGILPFSVAIFHQFPLAFLLTNLTILWTVPLLIVLCTILIFGYFFSPFTSVSVLLNWFLDQILVPYLSFLNETFPPLKSIYWSNLENSILIGLVLSLVIVAFLKKGKQISWGLSCLLLVVHTYRSLSDQKSEFRFESQIGKHSIWIEKKKTKAWFLSSDPKMTEERVNTLVENWKQKYGVAKIMAYKKTVGKDELTHSQKTFK